MPSEEEVKIYFLLDFKKGCPFRAAFFYAGRSRM